MNRPGGDGGMEDTKEDGEDADYITALIPIILTMMTSTIFRNIRVSQ